MKVRKEDFIQASGELFEEVQRRRIFNDSKTFVDSVPKRLPQQILEDFFAKKDKNGFDLRSFVLNNFRLPKDSVVDIDLPSDRIMVRHIELLWDYLLRDAEEENNPNNTLINIPFPYIIPGGRFREIYYWDSYFTMQGLIASGYEKTVENMINNFTYLIDKFGFIPNGNRIYYTTRSQPPFYAAMVKLFVETTANFNQLEKYLGRIKREYEFWMGNEHSLYLEKYKIKLNRYFDNAKTPREESYFEDLEAAQHLRTSERETLYGSIRAACESGWDFSSRWFEDGKSLSTCRAAEILPIDLNSLLYFTEKYIAQVSGELGNKEDEDRYSDLAERRAEVINSLFWDEEKKFYFDFIHTENRLSDVYSLAACYPLFFNLADKEKAAGVDENIEEKFLKPGGVITTVNHTGQQWDAPNGWAPLQWITIVGLRNYGFHELADKVKKNWLSLNEQVFNRTGKMFEKYSVEDISLFAGGGEYDLQDGFGWTNGVALALSNDMDLES